MGILYLFTMGLFGFGWIYDSIKYLVVAIKHQNNKTGYAYQTERNTPNHSEYLPVEFPAKRGAAVKRVMLCSAVVFLALIAFAFLPHISGFIALVAAILIIPIDKWQKIISRYIKRKVKNIVATAMAVLAFVITPTTTTPEAEPTVPRITITESTESTEMIEVGDAFEETIAATAEPATKTTIEPFAEPSIEYITPPTEETIMEPPSEIVTDQMMELESELTTQPATEPVTELISEPETELATEFTKNSPVELASEPVGDIATEDIAEKNMDSAYDDAEESTSELIATPSVEVETISFGEESYVIGVGRGVDIPFVLYPENATVNTLEATINNRRIATVSLEKKEDHVIQVAGAAPGKATITLRAGKNIIAKKDILIEEVLPEELKIVADTETPLIGSKGTFAITYSPTDVTTQKVTWKSSAPNILRVSYNGTYQAVSVGKATITATHTKGMTTAMEIEVLPVEVESVELTSNWGETKPFYRNDTMTIKAEILPKNATNKSVSWTSSDESIVTVSDKGVVKAISAGNATITATAANGRQGQYEVVVELTPQKFRVTAVISQRSNDHVGNSWSTGFEFNGEGIRSGSTVSVLPGDVFTVCGWAQDNDSNPDYGRHWQQLTLTNEMCSSGFVVEGEANVYENGGRYSGNCATWYVNIKFTPTR